MDYIISRFTQDVVNSTSIPSAEMDAGTWFLSFFKDFVGTPAILIGLFAMLGSILLRKKATDIILSFFKTCAGFLIIGGGAGVLVGALSSFQLVFSDLFGVTGIIPNNDAFAGELFEILPQIAQLGSIIMVVAMILNLLLAYTSRFKYIFLSGHVLFYMSVMIAGCISMFKGKDFGLDLNNPGDYTIALVSGSLIMSLYMVLSCAANKRFVKQITNMDDISLAHTGSLCYVTAGWIGELIYKIKKGQNIKSTEQIKFPKWLQFFRNTFASMAITMILVFLIVYIPEGIMYNTGIKQITESNKALASIFGKDASVNWLVSAIVNGFTFAAGVEILLYGVRMAVGELVPSFKGISEKVIKNAKAGVDCPIVFPFAPNAVLIGFLTSLIAGVVGLGVTIGLSGIKLSNNVLLPVVIPGIVAHFFLGATSGVYGNSKGGVLGCVLGSFVNGLIISFVPTFFFLAGQGLSADQSSLSWGDSDYLLGLIPGFITMIPNATAMRVTLIALPLLVFVGLSIDGVIKQISDKKKIALMKNNEVKAEEQQDSESKEKTEDQKKKS